MTRSISLDVPAGALPLQVRGPVDASDVPALVVVPSIFGPAPDLLERLGALGDDALVVAPDPFWRTGEGVVPYDDHDTAVGRLAEFDFGACAREMTAAVDWAKGQGNGRVVALGICFGGPYVLGMAARGLVDGVVTWHGSRLEGALDGVERITCPVRLHFGDADPVTPPEAIEAVRQALAEVPDVDVVVHEGATHGFSHDGDAWDPDAYAASFASVAELLDRCRDG